MLNEEILGFHMTSKKLNLQIFSFYLYQLKVIFKQISASATVDRFILKIENGFFTIVTSALFLGNMYVHENIDSPYVFEF